MENLSHLLPGDPVAALTGRESMAATNTVSVKPPYSGPGTPAESTSSAEAGVPGPSAIAHERVTVTHGEDSGLAGGRPLLKMGAWNDLTGGAS